MKTLVAYYSRSGNNRYLAEVLAEKLNAKILEIKPAVNLLFFQILFTACKFGKTVRFPADADNTYDLLVIAAPLWMGSFANPVRAFLKKYANRFSCIACATCCGSGETDKDSAFGYEKAFADIRSTAGERCIASLALSTSLLVSEDKKTDEAALMAARLDSSTFSNEIDTRIQEFVNSITEKAGH